jgi:hypothetical protein
MINHIINQAAFTRRRTAQPDSLDFSVLLPIFDHPPLFIG